MTQTGTTAPLTGTTGTIGPKCSFSDRVLEISAPSKSYLSEKTALTYLRPPPKHPKKTLVYDRVLIPFPDTTAASGSQAQQIFVHFGGRFGKLRA